MLCVTKMRWLLIDLSINKKKMDFMESIRFIPDKCADFTLFFKEFTNNL